MVKYTYLNFERNGPGLIFYESSDLYLIDYFSLYTKYFGSKERNNIYLFVAYKNTLDTDMTEMFYGTLLSPLLYFFSSRNGLTAGGTKV